jgi:holo-[acyl-carrier protein] synthase
VAIAGLGTDIVEIARLGKGIGANERLAKRVLTPAEWQQFSEHGTPVRFLAKRFAAKEAAVKALGTGIGNGISWQHIEVRNNDLVRQSFIFLASLLQCAKTEVSREAWSVFQMSSIMLSPPLY